MANFVRDMYEGVNRKDMTEPQRKAFRGEKLSTNPNVLFRIYRQGHLHILQFSSMYHIKWDDSLKMYPTIGVYSHPACNMLSLCGPEN